MVKSVLKLVYGEVRGLHQAAYVLALFAFGSQLLALLRDRLLAHQFGAGSELDIYYAAFRVPDLLFVLFASTLSVYVLIPFVAGQSAGGRGGKLLSQVFTVFLVGYSILALIVSIFAPYIVPILFPGFQGESESLVLLMRLLLLQPMLLGISSLLGVVTQLRRRFVLYALSPLIYNVGIIFGILVLYPFLGLPGIVWGVVLGALGHMLIQIPLVRKSELRFSITSSVSWKEIRKVLAVSIPRALTLSFNQIVLLVLIGIASTMTIGSVSVFQFAFNLQSVPLAIIGVSYSVAAFPMLAELYSNGAMAQFKRHIVTALRHIIFWSIPAIVLIVVLRAQLVRVVLGSGEFDWADTRLTAAILAILVLALVAQAVNLLSVRTLYAAGYTRAPFLVSFFGAILAIVGAFKLQALYFSNAFFRETLIALMRVPDIDGTEILMLALGYVIALIVQSVLLLVVVSKKFKINMGWLWGHIGRASFAGLMGGVAAYATLNFLVSGINPDRFLGIFIQGLVAGILGIMGVILTYYVLKTPELSEIYSSFRRKLFKTDV